jgi:hypothetical protein
VPSGEFADAEDHVWSYQQTDPNGHVHAMEYVRVMESFATDGLARAGRSPRDYIFTRARVLFRRPCFTGESYRRVARRFTAPDGEDLLIGAIHAVPEPGMAPSSRPVTLLRLSTKSLANRSSLR